ncbi:DegT/DnrJ/EryC1/StrS family aminotransferase [Morganella morganii]|uniref:DegT/DnrJ/EryC1/StrS family aminotransferase n=1 Tax=Morganella TaxID=581 RepID=UPI003709D2C7
MITKKPEQQNNCTKNLIFTKNARTAWNVIIGKFKTLETTMLLPSYIGRNDKEGSGVYDAILENNIQTIFYSLNSNLSINISDLENRIKNNNISILLVIHYFGFCRTDMKHIRDICTRNNIILVEDCAHYFNLSPDNKIGNYGDFSFFSIHKYLASSSGGILKVNNTKYYNDIKGINQKDDINADDLRIYANADLDLIYQKRKKNYLIFQTFFSDKSYLTSLYQLTSQDIPQTFPVLIHNDLREKLYFHLANKNIITISLYYRLIDEINKIEFTNSAAISNSILNLPIHQDTTENDIHLICKEIHEYLN